MDNKEHKEKFSNKEKYRILINARNFHYENFNKWMTYFYVMIGSVFVSFSYLIKNNEDSLNNNYFELLGVSIAGFIVSLFWHWANKGYYYWNINFITLVNHYEKNLLNFKEEERIYFTFANKEKQDYINPLKGANISTSKLSILLSYIITLFWATFSFFMLLSKCDYCSCHWQQVLLSVFLGILFIILLSITLAKEKLYSYHLHFPDLKIKTEKSNNYLPKEEITT